MTLRLQPPPGAGASAQVHLVVFPVDGTVAPRTILNARQAAHKAAMPDLEVVDDAPTEVASCAGHRLRFDGATKGDAARRRVNEVVWIREGKGFLFNLIGRPRTHDAQLANFDAVLASFGFPDS